MPKWGQESQWNSSNKIKWGDDHKWGKTALIRGNMECDGIAYDGMGQWEDGADLTTIGSALNSMFDGIANFNFDKIYLVCWYRTTSPPIGARMTCTVLGVEYTADELDVTASEKDTLIAAVESAFGSDGNLSVTNVMFHKKSDDSIAST